VILKGRSWIRLSSVTGLPRRRDRDRLRLHQARHIYALFMIAAGINAKALSAHGATPRSG